jgi:hypothetical protein
LCPADERPPEQSGSDPPPVLARIESRSVTEEESLRTNARTPFSYNVELATLKLAPDPFFKIPYRPFPPTVELVTVVVPDVAARRSPSTCEPATVTRFSVGAALDDDAVTRPDPPESTISTSVMEGLPACR